jgi:glutamine synthetase type III
VRVQPLPAVAAIAAVVAFVGSARAEDVDSLVFAKQGYFFVGGKYFDTPNGKVMAGASTTISFGCRYRHPR